jgi:hypothetical protein
MSSRVVHCFNLARGAAAASFDAKDAFLLAQQAKVQIGDWLVFRENGGAGAGVAMFLVAEPPPPADAPAAKQRGASRHRARFVVSSVSADEAGDLSALPHVVHNGKVTDIPRAAKGAARRVVAAEVARDAVVDVAWAGEDDVADTPVDATVVRAPVTLAALSDAITAPASPFADGGALFACFGGGCVLRFSGDTARVDFLSRYLESPETFEWASDRPLSAETVKRSPP